MLAQKSLRHTDQVRVEGPAQPAIRGDDNQKNTLLRTGFQKRMLNVFYFRSEIVEHVAKLVRIRACIDHSLLCTPQLSRRNGLHGFGKLLRIFYRPDAASDIKKARHG